MNPAQEPQGAERDAVIAQFCSITGASTSTVSQPITPHHHLNTFTDSLQAEGLLPSADWDLQAAVDLFFEEPEDQDMPPPTDSTASSSQTPATSGMGGARTLGGDGVPSRPVPTSSAAPSSSTARRQQPPQRGGIRTLRDMQGGDHAGHGHGDDDDDEDRPQDFFAGGEKSGLAVQNPNAGPNARDQVNSILDRARR